MRVHFTGIAGSGMGQLARLFHESGHEVRGSDISFDPPVGPELEKANIHCYKGYDSSNLSWQPELVVVGNAIRRDNSEAAYVREQGIPARSMSQALREFFLQGRRVIAACGTHGKTTTSAMLAHILTVAERDPGYFIGGQPKNLPTGAARGRFQKSLLRTDSIAPFVVEGDEYDAVYWHKEPKFLDYVGASDTDVVILTSVEHDHIDIYKTNEEYLRAFKRLAQAVPKDGLFVCDAHDGAVREVARLSSARVVYTAIQGDDTADVTPTWLAAPSVVDELGRQLFDLYAGGVFAGRFALGVPGVHNIRNALVSMAACAEGFQVSFPSMRQALASFEGAKRRQDLLGTPGGIHVYDDFAHHPTAVLETLRALRARHPTGQLFAVFEPRSATACRALHQKDYVHAFEPANRVLFAPLGRTNVPEGERLDLGMLAKEIGDRAKTFTGVEEIVEELTKSSRKGDVIAVLSNGAFGSIHQKLLTKLGS